MKRKKKYNKKVRNATATTFNGVKFKSKLEKFTYQCLKVAGIPFKYEEDRFVLIDKFKYKGEIMINASDIEAFEYYNELELGNVLPTDYQTFIYKINFQPKFKPKDKLSKDFYI